MALKVTYKKRYSKGKRAKRRNVVNPAVKKYVKSLLTRRIETKMLVTTNAGQDVYCNAGGAPGYLGFHVSSIGLGQNYNQRIGDALQLKSLIFNYVVTPDTNLDGIAHVRVMVLQALCKYSEANLNTELLNGVNPASAHPNDLLQINNPNYSRKYRIFYEHNFTVGSLLATASGNGSGKVGNARGKVVKRKLLLNIPHSKMDFVGDTTTSGVYGDLWIYVMTDKGTSSGDTGVSFRCVNTLFYTDA